MVQIYGRKKSMEIIMNQFDNNELSILNFLVCYYIGCEKTRLDENDIELLHTLKDKIYTIKEKQYETV